MKLRILLILVFLITNVVYAETPQPSAAQTTTSLTVPQDIKYETCTKLYENVTKENLFYLTLGAINANNFTIEEIQTNNGYIIFSAAKNKYLATIAGIDDKNSILKITPCNNFYHFQPGIVVNMFKYIELNKNSEFN